MTDHITLKKIVGNDDALLDIVFVHGLAGDAIKTWQWMDGSDFWPLSLFPDDPTVAIYTLGYPASLFEKWSKKEMDIFERATNVLEHFASVGIGNRPIVFVSHSLGGLLTKVVLRTSRDSQENDWRMIGEATRLVFFLSTPHTGASLASVFSTLAPHISSVHIQLLANESGVLNDINFSYRTFANERNNLTTVSYYEKYATMKSTVVVSKESADPGVKGPRPIPVDKDHISISKPTGINDLLFISIRRRIEKLYFALGPNGSNIDVSEDNYTQRSMLDRRDLHQKLVDAGLEHEYSVANRYQNQFAQRYTRLGLFSTAFDAHQNLLGEVEQRYITHVYHPLVCKGASDGDIAEALQTKVLDEITGTFGEKLNVNSKTVLSALYFLGEQCYIRWDKE